jgi:hypothetical protein
VRIETQGGSFSLAYHIFWNGHDRDPESIVREGSTARAFFLFATIKDEFSEDGNGFHVTRTWSIMTPGEISLGIEVRFDGGEDFSSCLFPGVFLTSEILPSTRSVLGEKTALPSALFVFSKPRSVLLFSSFPGEGQETASVGVRRVEGEEGALLAAEVRLPAKEEPSAAVGPRPEHREKEKEALITSTGSLERSHEMHVVFAPRESIVLEGVRAACGRLGSEGWGDGGEETEEEWKAAVVSCLSTHLCRTGGVMGLRELPGSPYLSASAGLSLSLLLLRLFPKDLELQETSLRLADFCLKGQHPSGLFFETYAVERNEWRGVQGRQGRSREGPLIHIGFSARMADLLLILSRLLADKGLPGEKYYLAGSRFVDFFIEKKEKLLMPGALHLPGVHEPSEKGISGLELLFPLARLFEATGRDKYAKALEIFMEEFRGISWDITRPPAGREGRDPDAHASLLCGRLAVQLRGMGIDDIQVGLFLSFIAQWIYVNRRSEAQAVDPVGGIIDSFRRQRLLFAGRETAYVLLSLSRLASEKNTRRISRDLARLALGFSRRAPIGTAFYQHTRWDANGKVNEETRGALGPVDSRRLTREVEFALRLRDEFPDYCMARERRRGSKER